MNEMLQVIALVLIVRLQQHLHDVLQVLASARQIRSLALCRRLLIQSLHLG